MATPETAPPTPTPDPILARIDQNIGTALGSLKEAKERITALEGENTKAVARIKALDETLVTQTEHLEKVEADLNKRRFNVGSGSFHESDALANALPDDLKKLLPRIAGAVGAKAAGHGFSDQGAAANTRRALARYAAADPAGYLASAGWFQAKFEGALAARRGQTSAVAKWSERADKLFDAASPNLDASKRAALQEDTASEGGYLIPTVTENMIGWLRKDAAVVRSAGATIISMTTKTHQLPTLASDFAVNWTSEEGTITDAAPAAPFGQGNLTAKKLTGLVTASIELIQDNIVNLMDFIMTHLLQQVGRAEDIQALEGDGTVFTGLFSVSGTASVAGGANALSEDELRKLIYGAEHATTLENGVIFAHPFIMRDAIGLAIASGSPWFATVFGVDQQGNARPRNIWGVPAFLTSGISKVRGGGTETTVYHGDPQYIVIGERQGIGFDVNPYSETEYKKGQILMRLLMREAILIWVPGYYTKLTAVTV